MSHKILFCSVIGYIVYQYHIVYRFAEWIEQDSEHVTDDEMLQFEFDPSPDLPSDERLYESWLYD